jgi:hypothetical protein
VRAPPKPKPNTALETDRVLRIFDALTDELGRRYPPLSILTERHEDSKLPWRKPEVIRTERPVQVVGPTMTIDGVLAVAERIAARTED